MRCWSLSDQIISASYWRLNLDGPFLSFDLESRSMP